MSDVNIKLKNMRKIILLAGPTASGKSALALKWAAEYDGEIVNADSMQIYKELRILTACPSKKEEEKVPHHLYRCIKGDQPCSAQDWKNLAVKILEDIWVRDKAAIIVGGTGLYFKTLIEGLSPVPAIDPAIREDIRAELSAVGSEVLHHRLSGLDQIMAEKLNARDGQRVARALEVILSTGKSLSHWQAQPPSGGLAGEENILIERNAVSIERSLLYDRCNKRFEIMMQSSENSSALDEVRALLEQGYEDNVGVMKSLGVRYLGAYLKGEIDLSEAITLSKTATRQYAKRQMTWFRNQCSDWNQIKL